LSAPNWNPLARARAIHRRPPLPNLGIGRGRYDEAALDDAQLRVQGGRRIIEHHAQLETSSRGRLRLRSRTRRLWQAAGLATNPERFANPACPILR